MSERCDFGTFGRYEEIPVERMPPEMRDAYEFTKTLRELVPGPHKIWLVNPKLSKTIVPTGAYYQPRSTLTKAEIEIATNVINGRWLAAYTNYEHGMIAQRAGGLPIARLVAGEPREDLSDAERITQQYATQLTALRQIDADLFAAAKQAFGLKGRVDIANLIGAYQTVCGLLNSFAIPSRETPAGAPHPARSSGQ
jgi:4-carboxymuconolactone decarboxylase